MFCLTFVLMNKLHEHFYLILAYFIVKKLKLNLHFIFSQYY